MNNKVKNYNEDIASIPVCDADFFKKLVNELIDNECDVNRVLDFIDKTYPTYAERYTSQLRNIVSTEFRNRNMKTTVPQQNNVNTQIQFNLIATPNKNHYIIEYPIPGFSREHVKTAKVYKANDLTYIRIECEKPCTSTYVQHDIKNVLKFDHNITAIAKNGIDKLLAKVSDGILTIEIITKQHECYDDIPFA